MILRPTHRQAFASGLWPGAVIGAAGAVAVLVLAGLGSWLGSWLGPPAWLAAVILFIAGSAGGGVFGLARGRDGGADVDNLGIHPVPALDGFDARWRCIQDLRVERWGGRRRVAVYLDTGQVSRLSAPYDGRMLAADRHFERKIFVLLNLWATHRRSGVAAR